MDYSELHSKLLGKGQAIENRKGDHVFFYIEVDGGMQRATKLSHNAHGQIDTNILDQISRQMRLTNRELRGFVACPISREQWLELWQQRGYLRRGT